MSTPAAIPSLLNIDARGGFNCSGGNAKEHVAELLNLQLGSISEDPLNTIYFIVQCIKGYAREPMALKFRSVVGIGEV